MKKILLTLDDDTFNLLPKKGNRSQIIRDYIKVYNSDISTDSMAQIKSSYIILKKRIDELSENLKYVTEILEYIKKKLPDQ